MACVSISSPVHNSWRGFAKTSWLSLLALLVVGQAFLAATPSAFAQGGVNGRNVTAVAFGQGGNKLGEYRQTSKRNWEETNAAGQVTFNFEEQQRDAWSVYLHDRSRDVNLQLDLHTRKVKYSQGNAPRADLYDVLSASSTPYAVNGRNVSSVVFGQNARRLGVFRQTGERQWVETNVGGRVMFNFEEVQRDDWSVYLLDRSRDVNLQLDLHTRKVMYHTGNAPRSHLYDVLSAQ